MIERKTFERKSDPLIPRSQFIRRMAIFSAFGVMFLCFSLVIGTAGYAVFAHLPLVDAFLNAAMILTGMGPVDKMTTDGGKLFASFYAIYSGVAFLTFCGVLFTPIYHRFIHRFHLDLGDE